ncbi:hypothetical protein [Bacillus wiedmannii]|uniref:hypothetical protein n=3 Tax=Bacillaceae TaxID=186817 RepID=UPI00159B884C|nr:hypothetical protein [Bacillus wiedmannii]
MNDIFKKIVHINFMYRNKMKVINVISRTVLELKLLIQFHSQKPNSNTFFHQKGDFIIFTCNNSIVTYIVKEVQKERYL